MRASVALLLVALATPLGCRRPVDKPLPAASASASARPVCPLTPGEQELADALASEEPRAESARAMRELALFALYTRHRCQDLVKTTRERMEGHLLNLDNADFGLWMDLVAPADPEHVLRWLERRAREAPYPTQTALAVRRAVGWVDCARPEQPRLVADASRALLRRDTALADAFDADGQPRKLTAAQQQALAENRDALKIIGSASIGLSKCPSTRDFGGSLLGVLRRLYPRLWPKATGLLAGMGETLQMLADLWGPDRAQIATDIAASEYFREGGGGCQKKVASWQQLGFSPVSFLSTVTSAAGDGELALLGHCLRQPLGSLAVPKTARGWQERARDLKGLVRVSPELGARWADRVIEGLGRVKIEKVTLDVTLAELVVAELMLRERGVEKRDVCQLLTRDFAAPPATLARWRQLAAAEAAQKCPAEASPLLVLPKPEDNPADFVEVVRRLGRRDRERAVRLAVAWFKTLRAAERAEMGARLLFSLSCPECQP